MKRAIFLDRDGVLNALTYYADTSEWESPRQPQDFQMLPGSLDALEAVQRQGWLLFLVSNQPSYAKGKTSLEDLYAVHAQLTVQLTARHVTLTEAYYCYHHPRGIVPEYTGLCACRKPGIGSLLKAQMALDLDLGACWFIGDQDIDVECGQRAGCRTILLDYAPSQAKRGASHPDSRCVNLAQAVALIGTAAGIKHTET